MWRTRVAVLSLLASAPALAQEGRITGVVTSAEDARPVASAIVSVRGTSAAAVTRSDGGYQLVVRPGTYTVVARRLGYAPDSATNVVVRDGQTATANVKLAAAATALGAVTVTVPYGGQQTGREQTGAVASVSPKEFNTGRIVSPEQLIRGKIAGVQVVDNNEPGGGIAVRIRGGTSVNASNDPLYVVDGVPLTIGGGTSSGRNPLNFINPNDIENITVLKDASATAIYGSRGANGVILVTTKSGRSGPQFTYTGTVSGSNALGGPDMVNAAEYRAAVEQYAPSNAKYLGTANTDWLGLVEQNGKGQEHDVGMNGRRQDAVYHLGLNLLDQEGVLKGTKTRRLAGTFNYSDRLLDNRLGVQTHLKGARTRDDYSPVGIGQAVALPATQPVTTQDGRYWQWPVNLGTNNPVADLSTNQDVGTTMRVLGNIEGEYMLPFVSGLTATVRGSFDNVSAERTTFQPSYAQSQVEAGTNPGNINRNLPSQLTTVLDAFGHYASRFASRELDVDVTAGYSLERFRGDYQSFYASGLSTNLIGLNGVPAATETRPFYNVEESLLESSFGRVNLTYRDKYLVTGTVRRDGSSRFAKDNQWGTFPSFGVAWRAIEEPWIKRNTPFSDLKFRASWGVNGNQSVGNYLAYTSYAIGQTTAQAQFGNQFVTTIRPSASDPNLRWEKTTSLDGGVEVGFLDDRVTASLDLYTKKTEDLLFSVPTAAGTALSNFITTNIGSMRNRGFELALNTIPFEGGQRGLTWNANFVASHNSNELTSIDRPGITYILAGPTISGGVGNQVQVLRPGYEVNAFYVYQHRRANGKPVYQDANGDGTIDEQDLYVDLNGDGTINQSDRRPFHGPQPRWILGHTSTLSWRGWDASTTLRAYLGNYVYNNVASNLGSYSVLQYNGYATNLHRSALANGFVRPQYLSDVYVEDASFLRMDNLTVGYTFARLAGVQNARVFGTIQNVFQSTKYSGVDPTAGLNGIDNNLYPRSRTFVGGLTLGF